MEIWFYWKQIREAIHKKKSLAFAINSFAFLIKKCIHKKNSQTLREIWCYSQRLSVLFISIEFEFAFSFYFWDTFDNHSVKGNASSFCITHERSCDVFSFSGSWYEIFHKNWVMTSRCKNFTPTTKSQEIWVSVHDNFFSRTKWRLYIFIDELVKVSSFLKKLKYICGNQNRFKENNFHTGIRCRKGSQNEHNKTAKSSIHFTKVNNVKKLNFCYLRSFLNTGRLY